MTRLARVEIEILDNNLNTLIDATNLFRNEWWTVTNVSGDVPRRLVHATVETPLNDIIGSYTLPPEQFTDDLCIDLVSREEPYWRAEQRGNVRLTTTITWSA